MIKKEKPPATPTTGSLKTDNKIFDKLNIEEQSDIVNH